MTPINLVLRAITEVLGWILEIIFTILYLIPNQLSNVRWVAHVFDGDSFTQDGTVKELWRLVPPHVLGVTARWEAIKALRKAQRKYKDEGRDGNLYFWVHRERQ
jgi:hypothetical protein